MKPRLFIHTALLLLAALLPHAPAQAGETIIYEKTTAYGPLIVSEDENGSRIMRFEKYGARQSVVKPGDPEHLELAYAKTAFSGLALSSQPNRFLIIGVGGGTLPMFLRKHYPEATIDAVDISPDVVQVAKQYFGFREDERMRAHVDDGRAFIEKVRQPYDVIFLDAFGSDSVPAHLTTQEFLSTVRRAVKADGVVVGNLWGRNSNTLYDAMIRTYQEVFEDLYVLEVRGAGNMIVLALPRNQPLDREEMAEAARKVSTAKAFRFSLGEMVNYGFLHAREKNSGVWVLRDPTAQKR